MRRRVLYALALFLLLGAAVLVFRVELVTFLLTRLARETLAQDAIADLPPGLHVVFCGAGGPMPDPARSGPCVGIIAGDRLLVIDAGTNGVRNLQRLGFAPGRIETVLLTHFHSDHIDGLGELAMQRWVGGAHTTPLPVQGPPGVEDIVAGFNTAYAQDARYRSAHHGPSVAPISGAGMTAEPFALPTEDNTVVVIEKGGLKVEAFAVDHLPVTPAVGYRVSFAGRSLIVSGDTARLPAMPTLAAGADLLVHEALAPNLVERLGAAAEATGQARIARITKDIVDYHASPREAAEIAAAAGVRALVFHHIVPPLRLPGAETAFLAEVGEVWSGETVVARDGTLISLPADDTRVEVTERF
jgi:ribonuclease Z